MSAPLLPAATRRQEADLLVCRLITEVHRLRSDLEELRAAASNPALLAAHPHLLADSLSSLPGELLPFDLQRLLTLIRQGL